jgi:arylsulfatase A-like enzyme
MNLYEEIVHVPMFIHQPGRGTPGTRRQALTQTIDLAPTFLDLYGIQPPSEMQGHSLLPIVERDHEVRPGALFGYFGGAINVTDGRYTFHCYPDDLRTQEIYQYTLMPTHIWDRFSVEELKNLSLAPPFDFTKGVQTMKVRVIETSPMFGNYGPGGLLEHETRLYDLSTDPGQETPLQDPAVEKKMATLMGELMQENEAPPEAFERVRLAERTA